MTQQAEFDALFAAAWAGGDAPTAGLADWLVAHAPRSGEVPIETQYTYADEDTGGGVAELTVYAPAGLPDAVAATFGEPTLGLLERRHFPRDRLAVEFPGWLTGVIEDLYYVLSK